MATPKPILVSFFSFFFSIWTDNLTPIEPCSRKKEKRRWIASNSYNWPPLLLCSILTRHLIRLFSLSFFLHLFLESSFSFVIVLSIFFLSYYLLPYSLSLYIKGFRFFFLSVLSFSHLLFLSSVYFSLPIFYFISFPIPLSRYIILFSLQLLSFSLCALFQIFPPLFLFLSCSFSLKSFLVFHP